MATSGTLEREVHADVCVVGAGLAGLLSAYALMQEGKRVVVLDDGPVGAGETARRIGHLRTIPDQLAELSRAHGHRTSQLLVESHQKAIERLEDIVGSERIACDWKRVPGYLLGDPDDLQIEARAAREAGCTVDRQEVLVGRQALRFEDQARVDPMALAAGLAKVLQGAGVRIYTDTHASRLEQGSIVSSTGRAVRCEHVVEATGAPVFGTGFEQQAHRRYAIAAQAPPVEDAIYWEPKRSLRLAGEHVVVSGAEHPVGRDPDHGETFGALEIWGREHLGTGDTTHRWSLHLWRPRDGLPLIGRAGGTYVATGDAGNGVAHAAVASHLIADLITGRENPYQETFDPQRTDVPSVAPWQNVRKQMAAARRRVLMPGQVKAPEEVVRGQGAIQRRGIRLFALARDEDGVLHERFGVCPSDGTIVAWNAAEKSWDCLYDGSRFDRYGTVINAPANRDLGSYDIDPRDGIVQHPLPERVEAATTGTR